MTHVCVRVCTKEGGITVKQDRNTHCPKWRDENTFTLLPFLKTALYRTLGDAICIDILEKTEIIWYQMQFASLKRNHRRRNFKINMLELKVTDNKMAEYEDTGMF
jgi:hypothetical protein